MRPFSFDKIVENYFAALATEDFSYAGRQFRPKPLVVSPYAFRKLKCPEGCGACCLNFSLDYRSVPENERLRTEPVEVELAGIRSTVYSDRQNDNNGHFCRNLEMSTSRCLIQHEKPLSCRFETYRFLHYSNRSVLINKVFGRGWNMKKTNGEYGVLCEIDFDEESFDELLGLVTEIGDWMDDFHLPHRCKQVVSAISALAGKPARLLVA